MNFYKILNIATAALFVYLFSLLMFSPQSFIEEAGLTANTASLVIARRAAIFMLGVVVLLLGSMNYEHGKQRRIVCLFVMVTLFGLATMGIYELGKGTVNSSMVQAVVIETVIGAAYFGVLISNRRSIGSFTT